eukprot:CAMPEP_0178386162 /NCGR_PEP_ID=MMETSP0689_2-20121128/8417_1 /TAXON_ID=160604 /ORGANISM="Amphidinium massartii, Strain CS-259" /LENGTH=31 /DNA_ID= /DNA_START= /DNA_END= /DNA_ORIENTATION=
MPSEDPEVDNDDQGFAPMTFLSPRLGTHCVN